MIWKKKELLILGFWMMVELTRADKGGQSEVKEAHLGLMRVFFKFLGVEK